MFSRNSSTSSGAPTHASKSEESRERLMHDTQDDTLTLTVDKQRTPSGKSMAPVCVREEAFQVSEFKTEGRRASLTSKP